MINKDKVFMIERFQLLIYGDKDPFEYYKQGLPPTSELISYLVKEDKSIRENKSKLIDIILDENSELQTYQFYGKLVEFYSKVNNIDYDRALKIVSTYTIDLICSNTEFQDKFNKCAEFRAGLIFLSWINEGKE